MTDLGYLALLDLTIVAMIALAVGYLHRYRLPRPPVGRFTRSDVLIMSCLLVALPFGYLSAPIQVVSGVFAVMFLGTAQLTLAPVLGGRAATAAGFCLVTATIAAGVLDLPRTVLFLNAVLIVVALVGVTNLWTQTGMTAGHVAALAAVLVGYDLVATGLSTTTDRFVSLVNGYPFAPMLAVTADDPPIAAGLGDCLMLVLWPLVAWKAYGRLAGWLAATIGVGLVVAVHTAFLTDTLADGVPFLLLLGPAILVQYATWYRLRGPGRRTHEWLTPGTASEDCGRPDLVDALRTVRAATAVMPGTWVAVHEGAVVGEGPTPGSARRAARLGGCAGPPVVLLVSR